MDFYGILTTPYVTLGCPTLGTIIMALAVQRWWKKGGGGGKGKKGDDGGSGRSVLALLPFFLAWCWGMLAILASPGLSALGIVTKLGLWSGNGVGYAYLVYGIGGSSPTVTRANPVTLTAGGYAMFSIWTALAIGNYVWGKRLPRKLVIFGALSGIFMAMAAGVAGVVAIPLASGINLSGAWYTGIVG